MNALCQWYQIYKQQLPLDEKNHLVIRVNGWLSVKMSTKSLIENNLKKLIHNNLKEEKHFKERIAKSVVLVTEKD